VPPATAPRPPPAERAAPGPAPTPRPPSKTEKARSSPPPEAAPPPPAKELEFDDGRALAWRWPAQGPVVTGFAPGAPARKGIDIAGRLGQPVIASEAGRVVYAGDGLIGYGRLVILKHNKNYLSAYGYNRKLLVREGDAVKRGQRLAEMGRDIQGKPRLHFEIRRNGTPVNPMKLLPRNPG